MVAQAGNPTPGSKQPTDANSHDSSVTIPSHLFERLLDDFKRKTVATLYDYLSIDPEEQEKIYPAYQIAEKAAKEKQRALSSTGAGKIVLKVEAAVTIRGLDETAIDACIEVFSKNLKIAISDNTRKAICISTRRELKRDFSKTFTIQLHEQGVKMSADGKKTLGATVASLPEPVMPANLAKYYLQIQHYKDGKPAGHPWTVFPDQIMEGQRYDFLTIETGEEAAKPAAKNPMEAPAK